LYRVVLLIEVGEYRLRGTCAISSSQIVIQLKSPVLPVKIRLHRSTIGTLLPTSETPGNKFIGFPVATSQTLASRSPLSITIRRPFCRYTHTSYSRGTAVKRPNQLSASRCSRVAQHSQVCQSALRVHPGANATPFTIPRWSVKRVNFKPSFLRPTSMVWRLRHPFCCLLKSKRTGLLVGLRSLVVTEVDDVFAVRGDGFVLPLVL